MPSAQEPTEVFDYIVVGAGSSGSAVAARLSANGEASVLLLEAGLRDRKPAVHIPAAFSQLFRSDRDWNYDTIPQPELGDRRIYWPRGKMLGGSSSLNAMMWVRGFAADYDKWAEAARPTWSWSSLLPYFRQVERVAGTHRSDEGSSGAISISAQRQPRSHTAAFLEAVTQLGMSVERVNSAEPGGFAQTMVSQRRGARFSAADAYLKPARTRANLTVRVDAQAGRVLFDGKDAVGIEYFVGRERRRVTARREVVLCGGAVNTPQLLMLSGIGDGAALSELGIKMVKNSPEVGKNLVDHLIAGLVVEANGDTLYSAQRPAELARYLLRRKGMLTSNVAEAYGFVRTRSELPLPDIEILFAPVAYVGQGLEPPPTHGLTIGAILLQPESSGRITLAVGDPMAPPSIDPRYLSDPAGRDRATLLAGLAVCELILQAPALRAVHTGHFLAPADSDAKSGPARDLLSVNDYSHTLYHPVGTARMGSDSGSVVDPELRVRGVSKLRVADASVMPNIIRGHTNAPAIVIGEKAADLIMAS